MVVGLSVKRRDTHDTVLLHYAQKVVSFARRKKNTVMLPTFHGEDWDILLRSIREKSRLKVSRQ